MDGHDDGARPTRAFVIGRDRPGKPIGDSVTEVERLLVAEGATVTDVAVVQRKRDVRRLTKKAAKERLRRAGPRGVRAEPGPEDAVSGRRAGGLLAHFSGRRTCIGLESTGIRDGMSSIGNFSALSQFFQTQHKHRLVRGIVAGFRAEQTGKPSQRGHADPDAVERARW